MKWNAYIVKHSVKRHLEIKFLTTLNGKIRGEATKNGKNFEIYGDISYHDRKVWLRKINTSKEIYKLFDGTCNDDATVFRANLKTPKRFAEYKIKISR